MALLEDEAEDLFGLQEDEAMEEGSNTENGVNDEGSGNEDDQNGPRDDEAIEVPAPGQNVILCIVTCYGFFNE